MYGKYPRSAYVAYLNPAPGKEAEFNYWHNYIHVPDILGLGVFDRVYRFEAIVDAKASATPPGITRRGKYLVVWESDYADLREAIVEVHRATERLRASGRMWPVGETVWAQPFFAVGPAKPYNHKPVTFLESVHVNCGSPGREEEFNRWYNDLHLPEFLGSGYVHSAYRFERYDPPQEGEERFLALYESSVDLAKREAFAGELRKKALSIWYEQVGENRLKVRQQAGQPPRPRDLIMERVRPNGIWRLVWPQVEA